MGSLEEKLQEATLRGQGEVSAVVTDVEIEAEYTGNVVVHYRVGSDDDETIDEAEHFDVPTENTEEYRFVRFCRSLGVPLTDAHDELVGEVVTLDDDGGTWSLPVPPKEETGATDEESSSPGRLRRFAESDRPLGYVRDAAFLVGLPAYVPAILWSNYREEGLDGLVGAVLVSGLLLLAWVFAAWVLSLPLQAV